MRRLTVVLLMASFLAGCLVERVPTYSPRRSPTPEHRAATKNEDCRTCHDVQKIRKHAASDNCLHCHHLCRECSE